VVYTYLAAIVDRWNDWKSRKERKTLAPAMAGD
jgi:hypothetical protein